MKKLNLIIVTFLCTLCFGFNNQTFGCVSTITPTGPTTFCSGTNLLTLTSSNAASYKWYNNGVLIVGAASKVYKPLVTGNYHVVTTSGIGCTATSAAIAVTVNALPVSQITASGPTTFCSGNSLSLINTSSKGNAICLDGADDYATIPNSVSAAAAFTFEAWVNCSSNATWQRVLDFGNAQGINMFLTPFGGAGKPRFAINIGAGEQIVDGAAAFPTGSWQHIAVTIGAGKAKMYINGVLSGSNNSFTYTPASLGATVNNWIGKSQYPDPYLNACIDEVRIWNVVRTPGAILANYNKTVTNISTGLVAYYRFDSPTGDKTFNSVTGTNDGTLNNGVSYQVPSTAPTGTVHPSYLWSTGATTEGVTATNSKKYFLTITDANGCTKRSARLNTTLSTVTANIYVNFNEDSLWADAGVGYTYQWYDVYAYTIPGGALVVDSIVIKPGYTSRVISPGGWVFALGVFPTRVAQCLVTNAAGCSQLSNLMYPETFRLAGDGTNSIDNMSLFPNPASNQINIRFQSADEKATLQVYNVTGQKVVEQAINSASGIFEKQLDINALPAGIYILTVQTATGIVRTNFIKQ